jgi:hypothetical protein
MAMHWLMFALSFLTIVWISFQRPEDEMNLHQTIGAVCAEACASRTRKIAAGAIALAVTFLPLSAKRMDSPQGPTRTTPPVCCRSRRCPIWSRCSG